MNDLESGREVDEQIQAFVERHSKEDLERFSSALKIAPAAKLRHVIQPIERIAEVYRNQSSLSQWQGHFIPARDDLLSFFHDRLKVYLRDQGVRHDVIDACISMPGNDDLALLVKRAKALQAVLDTEDGENLVQGFKRANNIFEKEQEKDGVEYSFGRDERFATEPEEIALFKALTNAEESIAVSLKNNDFSAATEILAGLRKPIDEFFEAVHVNTDNAIARRNRLNLLGQIRSTCLQVADLTRIEG